ncbi:MAG: MFS transporter [Micrococcales bacterium]
MFFTHCFSATVWVPRIPQLIDQIGVNFVQWGTMLGLTGLGALLPLMFTNRLVSRFGTRPVIRIAAALVTGFLVAIPWSHNWAVFFALQMAQTMAFSAYNIAVNSAGVMLQKKMQKTILGNLHAAWSIGAASSAALSGLLVFMNFQLNIFIVGAVCALSFQLAGRKLLEPTIDGHNNEAGREQKISWLRTPPFVWLLTAGLFTGVWPEVVMIDWSSVFGKKVLLLDPGLSAIPYTVFTVAMIIGRLAINPVTKRFHISQFSKWGGMIGSAFMLSAVVVGPLFNSTDKLMGLLLSSILFGIAGFGVGPMVPSFFSAAGNVLGLTTAQALSRMSMMNTFIILGAKTLMGAIAQGSVQLAFFFPVVTLFAAGIISASVVIKAKKNEDAMLRAFPMTGPIDLSEVN